MGENNFQPESEMLPVIQYPPENVILPPISDAQAYEESWKVEIIASAELGP